MILELAFWFVTAAFATPLLLYPLGLLLLARFRKPGVPGKAKPKLTLAISAYNEVDCISNKIANALAIDYPAEQLEIAVVSDSSDDGTDDVVKGFSNRGVILHRQEMREGKSVGLSEFCSLASGEILVFTDANSMFEPDALEKLVRHFDDPKVGYTVGKQLYNNPTNQSASADSENVYWSLELKLKEWESRLSSVVGADGAIFALRKELFEPMVAEDINDFLLPLKAVAKGYQGVFEPEAVCVEDAAPDFQGEFRRKCRIVSRGLLAVYKVPQCLNPFKVGWFAFQLLGHKLLRWLTPLFLLVMFATSGWLATSGTTERTGLYLSLLILQVAGYATAALYAVPMLRRFRLVYFAYYFFLINFAAIIGISLFLSGRTIGVWKPQR